MPTILGLPTQSGGLNGAEVIPAALPDGTTIQVTAAAIAALAATGVIQCIPITCSDETTALTTGTSKITLRNPFNAAFNLTGVKASLSTAQTSGSIFTVNVKESGVTILSTKITVDNTEKTSITAATLPVISDSVIAADGEITVDIDQVGDGTAKGLKVYLIGHL